MKKLKINKRKERGITLIALVVTIIVLIILATVSINIVTEDGGILTKADQAKYAYEMSEVQQRFDMAILEVKTKNKGQTLLEEYIEHLKEKGIIEPESEVTNPDGSIEVTTPDGWVVQIEKDGEYVKRVVVEGKADNLPVRITNIQLTPTTHDITVKLTVLRGEKAKYSYYYKQGAITDEEKSLSGEELIKGNEWKRAENKTDKLEIVIGEDIEQAKQYTVMVEAIEENVVRSRGYATVSTKDVPIAEGAITFGELSWEGGLAKVTVSKTTQEYHLQYQVVQKGTLPVNNKWKTVEDKTTNEVEVGELDLGQVVVARLWDGYKGGASISSFEVKDEVAPSATINLNNVTNIMKGEKIKATVTLKDDESGINISKCKWILHAQKENLGTADSSYTTGGYACGTFNSETQTIDNAISTEGTYYLHVLSVDNTEANKVEIVSGAIRVKTPKTVAEAVSSKTTFTETTQITDVNGDLMWVPKDFKVVEGESIDTGVVIEDGVGNQFVWVPVPEINDMVMCKEHNTATITFDGENFSCSGTGAEDKHTLTQDQLAGKLYDFTGTGAQAKSSPISYPSTPNSSFREPDIVTRYDTKDNLKIIQEGLTPEEFKAELQIKFNDMIKSVGYYKGFYIGRYGTSGLKDGETPKVKKGETPTVNTDWYTMYKNSKNLAQKESKVTSSMIWGCQWDAVMNWFISCGGTTATYVTNSTNMGWYSASTGGDGKLHNTGAPLNKNGNEVANRVNNIYDMAGNAYEWTLEAKSTGNRVGRGGYYYYSGSDYPASSRDGFDPTNILHSYLGSRATLYVNK